jgi:UDP-3-O-[3-hydroxymyristoyl] glucosamine N-acyltransferase
MIHDVAPLDLAGANDLSFLDNRKYAAAFAASAALTRGGRVTFNRGYE